MNRFERPYLAIIPILSLLCMSPVLLEKQVSQGRSIASVNETSKARPRFDKLTEKVKPEDKAAELSSDDHKDKLGGLKLKLLHEREQFMKKSSDKSVVEAQRKSLEEFVSETLLVEGALKKLQEKKEIEDVDAKVRAEVIEDSKDLIEELLSDLEENEVLVAKVTEPKKDDKPQKPAVVVVPQQEEKKEDPKKEEGKKEEKKDDKVCEADEKNKVLTKQVEDLLKQQNQILQTMLGMAQMMVSMHQQQQNQNYQYGPGWNQSPYQYHQPMTAGNWVYYPSGFQPLQTNIFQQPSMLQYQMTQRPGGIFPDQINGQQIQPQQPSVQMQQPSWSMQPDPRFSIQPGFTPGNFGQPLNNLGFNMNQVPVTSFIP